jgi:hypothetical protein
MISQYIISVLAGWGAGAVTGIIGASAAAVIVPVLITFLDIPTFEAIGISLATDVVASLVAANTYRRNGNIDLKSGLQMAISAIVGAIIGTWISSYVPSAGLGGFTGVAILLIGINFIRKPLHQRIQTIQEKHKNDPNISNVKRITSSILWGLLIGFIAGFVGAGGGVMILLILTLVLRYKIHVAVGTSVLIMAFTALSGAVSHALYAPIPWDLLAFAVVGGAVGSKMAATFANNVSEEKLSKIAGVAFILLGAMTITDGIIS